MVCFILSGLRVVEGRLRVFIKRNTEGIFNVCNKLKTKIVIFVFYLFINLLGYVAWLRYFATFIKYSLGANTCLANSVFVYCNRYD